MSNQGQNQVCDLNNLLAGDLDVADEDRRDVHLAVGVAIECFERAVRTMWEGE